MKQTTAAILAMLLALGNTSFSKDKDVKKEVNKTITTNKPCEVCQKGRYIVTHQNVVVFCEGQFFPLVNARYLKCNHCLNLKEDFVNTK